MLPKVAVFIAIAVMSCVLLCVL